MGIGQFSFSGVAHPFSATTETRAAVALQPLVLPTLSCVFSSPRWTSGKSSSASKARGQGIEPRSSRTRFSSGYPAMPGVTGSVQRMVSVYWSGEVASLICSFYFSDRLVGLEVKASASRAAVLGSIPAFAVGLFLGRVMPVIKKKKSSSGYPARHLAWLTGWPGVRVLWLFDITSLICNFYLSVLAR